MKSNECYIYRFLNKEIKVKTLLKGFLIILSIVVMLLGVYYFYTKIVTNTVNNTATSEEPNVVSNIISYFTAVIAIFAILVSTYLVTKELKISNEQSRISYESSSGWRETILKVSSLQLQDDNTLTSRCFLKSNKQDIDKNNLNIFLENLAILKAHSSHTLEDAFSSNYQNMGKICKLQRHIFKLYEQYNEVLSHEMICENNKKPNQKEWVKNNRQELLKNDTLPLMCEELKRLASVYAKANWEHNDIKKYKKREEFFEISDKLYDKMFEYDSGEKYLSYKD